MICVCVCVCVFGCGLQYKSNCFLERSPFCYGGNQQECEEYLNLQAILANSSFLSLNYTKAKKEQLFIFTVLTEKKKKLSVINSSTVLFTTLVLENITMKYFDIKINI